MAEITPPEDNFWFQYSGLLKTALESGSSGVGFNQQRDWSTIPRNEVVDFIRRCHWGYERAQLRLVDMLSELQGAENISDAERNHRELCLRKVADAMATTMLKGQDHIMRRMMLHDDAPPISLTNLRRDLVEVQKFNHASRMQFALLADLTTFIHTCDVLRIDMREKKVSFVELKTGRVNSLLLSKLAAYEPTPESLERVVSDPQIDPSHLSQAKRILRQKLRLHQSQAFIHSDEGTDIVTGKPLMLSREKAEVMHYDELLNDICRVAKSDRMGGGVVSNCVHLGAGYGNDPEIAHQVAIKAVKGVITQSRAVADAGLLEIEAQTKELIGSEELFKTADLFDGNLHGLPTRPVTMWCVDKEILMAAHQRKLVVVAAFDVAGYIWLGKQLGLKIEFTSRKEAEEAAREYGSSNMATWAKRALRYVFKDGRMATLFSGLLGRYMLDLLVPSSLMRFDIEKDGNFFE